MDKFIFAIFFLIGLSLCQTATPAPEVDNNTPGIVYAAMLQSGPGPVHGSIVGTSAPDGIGVNFAVSFAGFPVSNDSKYTYHIHAKPVAADGNCSSTGGHLDPYHAGLTSSLTNSTYKCDPSMPSLCELGDLAGKHGSIDGATGSYSASYRDTFLSTTPGTPAFFGNLSVVVHRASDNARLNCGNFTVVSGNGTTFTDASTSTTSSPTISTSMAVSNYTVGTSGTGTGAALTSTTTTTTYTSVTADQTQYSASPTLSIPTSINAAVASKHFDTRVVLGMFAVLFSRFI